MAFCSSGDIFVNPPSVVYESAMNVNSNGIKSRQRKQESNRKGNDRLKPARANLRNSGLEAQAREFVKLMLGDHAPTGRPIAWKNYQRDSERLFEQGHDCKLPCIPDLHLLLREMARNEKRRSK